MVNNPKFIKRIITFAATCAGPNSRLEAAAKAGSQIAAKWYRQLLLTSAEYCDLLYLYALEIAEDNETNNDNNAVQYHRQQQGVTTWSDTVLKYNANIRRLEEQLAQVNAQVVKYGSLFLNVQKGVAKMVLKFQKPTIQHYFSLWVQCTQSNKQVAKIALRQSANLKLMRMAMQMRVASEETTTGTAAH